jgi:hypothetical protein
MSLLEQIKFGAVLKSVFKFKFEPGPLVSVLSLSLSSVVHIHQPPLTLAAVGDAGRSPYIEGPISTIAHVRLRTH